jgi:hypothetical protein
MIEFNATNTLVLYVEGTLESNGIAGNPVIFTSSQGAVGAVRLVSMRA